MDGIKHCETKKLNEILEKIITVHPSKLNYLFAHKLSEIELAIEIERDVRTEHLDEITNPLRLAARSERRQFFKKVISRKPS